VAGDAIAAACSRWISVCLYDYRAKCWFSRRRGWRGGYPISWEGWAWLIGIFVAEIFVSQELQGAIRVIAFFVVIVRFLLAARGRILVDDH
jgi:hypothetical protein